MISHFGRFVLNDDARTLMCDGVAVALQPKVFDVLAYLVSHADRVVPTEELLQELWPGVLVVDSAVQRAVSLARSALASGGLADAIETHRGRGYRFVGAVSLDGDSNLAEDVEGQAVAAELSGDVDGAVRAYEQAVQAYQAVDRGLGAARCALRLANLEFERTHTNVAKGWMGRAQTLLKTLPEASEHSQYHWLATRFATAFGNINSAISHADEAMTIGQRCGDAQSVTMAMVYKGLALIAAGNVTEGIALQDEAAAAVLSGSTDGLLGGMVYCSVIWSCCNLLDWDRARQWTEHFSSWCAENSPGTLRGPAVCIAPRYWRWPVISLARKSRFRMR